MHFPKAQIDPMPCVAVKGQQDDRRLQFRFLHEVVAVI